MCLAIKEMEIKITRYHLTPTRMRIMSKTDSDKF